ncbi:hypothetical protein [Nonomuraea dietziae]|uniref:hypothetical protein n=1 Tax=Nonomuraea dietziae TaxID=65515 RepID=UPI003444DAEC
MIVIGCEAATPDSTPPTGVPTLETSASPSAAELTSSDVQAPGAVGEGGAYAAPRAQAYNDNVADARIQAVEGQHMWGNDWCHYFVQNGQWYGDVCLRPSLDPATNQIMPDTYNVYLFNPNQPENLGQFTNMTYFGMPGYNVIRNPNDPVYRAVHWMRWPSNVAADKAEPDLMVMDHQEGKLLWYPASWIYREVADGNGYRYGFPLTPQKNRNDQNLRGFDPDIEAGIIEFQTRLGEAVSRPWTLPDGYTVRPGN